MQAKNLFLKNAMILTAASLVMRGLGMVFRIYISNILGSEGMGLYQLIFSVYMLASTVASAGISLAVTRLVSEEQLTQGRRAIKNLLLKLSVFSLFLGIVTAIILYTTSPFIGTVLLHDMRTVSSLRVLSGSLPFMAVSAALRGYFMARRRITFTSVTQLSEQAVRFVACFVLLYFFGKSEIGFACFIIMAADCISEIVSFFVNSVYFSLDLNKIENKKTAKPIRKTFSRFFAILLPVSMVRFINSALYTVENIIVPLLMTAFFASRSVSLSQWGLLKGMALPLLMFPSGFLASFVSLLVPEISENRVSGKNKENQKIVTLCFKFTFALSILSAGVFYLLSDEMGMLLFKNKELGFFLRVLAPLVPFIYMENVAEGVLKGLGQQMCTLWYSIINSLLRIGLIYVLVAYSGMKGFLLVMLVSNIVTSILHQNKLLKTAKIKLHWMEVIIKPILCAICACLFARLLLLFLTKMAVGTLLSTLLPALLAVTIFAIFIFAFGIITKEDINLKKYKKNDKAI